MWDEVVKSLTTQFPVLAATAGIVWWMLRWTTARHDAEMARNDQGYARLIAEKDARLADQEKQVLKLDAEVAELKGKLSRSRKKGKRKPTGKNP